MSFDLAEVDRLLTTTRAVRKRLDLERPVEPKIVEECLSLALQAPNGSNTQKWQWMVVADADKRAAIASFYQQAGRAYMESALKEAREAGEAAQVRIYESVVYLLEHLAEVPVFVIPCVEGKLPEGSPNISASSHYGSIYPAIWSFQLALRSRGLGTVVTTLHLGFEQPTAELLGIPDNVSQVCMLPVAYTKGTDFKAAPRRPIQQVVHWDSWAS